MNKEPLLFLCHRIPYPPNKGDKIRSFNILKKLAESYEVHLGCFIDDPFDEQYVDTLRKYCKTVFALKQDKMLCKVKGLTAFLSNKPVTLPYYFDSKMQQWVNKVSQQQRIDKIFIYSSSMAQYCESKRYSKCTRVIDFVDIDSDKWRQYAAKKRGIARWFFNREYRQLAIYENKIAAAYDASLFVSEDEAQMFRQHQPVDVQQKVHSLLNGVDVEFFDPNAAIPEDVVCNSPYLVFTGAMDYWANIDSVIWFARFVWPKVLAQFPQAKFYIVGGNPDKSVLALDGQSQIIVTGRVHDIRPFIKQAHCVVAPMQIARGIQNKVLEAMSLAKPVVVTSMAMEGINAPASDLVKIVDQPEEMAAQCIEYLQNLSAANGNRQWILQHFTWQQTLTPLLDYFESETSTQ